MESHFFQPCSSHHQPEPHRFHLAGAANLRDALPARRLEPVVFWFHQQWSGWFKKKK